MANLRVRIDDGFETFGRWLYRNRLKTLLMMLVVVAAFGSQLPRLTFDTSNESYFHEEDPTLREYDAFREQFGREEMLIIALRPPEVFDRAFLKWLADFHAALEAEVPYVKEITSLVNVRNTRGEGDELIVHDCDLDACKPAKQSIFDFAAHRRIEHYGLIAGRTAAVPPDKE